MKNKLNIDYDYKIEGLFNTNDEGYYLYFVRTNNEDRLVAKVPKREAKDFVKSKKNKSAGEKKK